MTIVTTSWDDGHVVDLKLASLLRANGIAGTFYISPVDREIPHEKRLTATQVRDLSHDFEIGAHTLTHPRLSTINDDEARKEIDGSKKVLEASIGKPVTSFCYPGGDYLPIHKLMVRDAGFKLARTVDRFATKIGDDHFAVPTTMHAYRHWSDAGKLYHVTHGAGAAGGAKGGLSTFVKQYLHWDELAIALFEKTLVEGGVFHLWGHSWEIDARGDWKQLERVVKHIARRPGVEYRTNAELV